MTGFSWARKIVDDTLVWAPDLPTLAHRLRLLLYRCRERGITMSRSKFQVGEEMTFAGHVVSAECVRPDPDLVGSLKNFPRPQTIKDLRAFLGIVNQVAFFVPDLAHMSMHLRQLLKKDNAWAWSLAHEEEFTKLKRLLVSDMVVHPFDPLKPATLITDASRTLGLGYALMQPGEDGKDRLVMCGSCSLTTTQQRYATVELEMLGVTWAICKCAFFLRGLSHFTVKTDHRPLVGIFEKNLMDMDNARLQRMREKVMEYNFTIQWLEGKLNTLAEALSHAPHFALNDEIDENTIVTAARCDAVDPALSYILEAADGDYQRLVSALLSRTPGRDLPNTHPAKAYAGVWDKLSLRDVGGRVLAMYDCARIVVPDQARRHVLNALHSSHAGCTRMKTWAKQLYYWPSMNNDIKTRVETCHPCRARLPSQATLKPIHRPATQDMRPMERIGADLFELDNQTWLVAVDAYSGYAWPAKLGHATTHEVWKVLTMIFNSFGWPQYLRSDGGPQFRKEFADLCATHHITHELASAYNPASNGQAEAAVRSMKLVIGKAKEDKSDIAHAIYAWRVTPREDGYSPFDLMFARKGRLPDLPTIPHSDVDPLYAEIARDSKKNKNDEQQSLHAKDLPMLQEGQAASMQHATTKKWTIPVTVLTRRRNGQSYIVRDENGATYLRSRRLLRPRPDEDN